MLMFQRTISCASAGVMLNRAQQHGAALFISLVILLVLSVIGISAMRGGLLQSFMATNMQRQEIARSGADSAVASVWALATEQKLNDGGILAIASESTDNTFEGFIDGSGAITLEVARLDDDGVRSEPVLISQVTVQNLGCAPTACGMTSLVSKDPQCTAFRIDGTTTVGNTQDSVSTWLSLQTAGDQGATPDCADTGGGAP